MADEQIRRPSSVKGLAHLGFLQREVLVDDLLLVSFPITRV